MNECKKMEFKFDYFSVTFPLECHKDDEEREIIHQTVMMIGTYLNIEGKLIHRQPRPTNRFRVEYKLGESIIFRAGGPCDKSGFPTCQLELKGEGCREFEYRNPEKNWLNLMTFLNILNAKATRIDVAIDDFSNQIDLDWLDKKARKRFYTSSIISKPKPIGTFDDGYSITFGTTSCPLQLCIYDKKYERQVNGRTITEDTWTRYELRYRGDKAKQLFRELYKLFKSYPTYMNKALKEYSFGLLYKALDIKCDNNYSVQNQKRATTDPLWKNFLENANKITIPSGNKNQLSYEAFMQRHEKSTVDYLLFHYMIANRDPEEFEIELYKMLYRNTIHDKARFHRLNLYLDQIHAKTLNDEEIEELRKEFYGIISAKELPF